jgi:hypothetical protein
MSLRRSFSLLVMLTSAVAAISAPDVGDASANPHKCVVITDGDGNTINTTCVPWLLDDPALA